MNIADILLKKTMKAVTIIAENENIQYDKNMIIQKMKDTYKERLKVIIETAHKEAKEADFLNGIENGKIHSLVNTVGKVSIEHGCLMYAKFLLGIEEN